ESNMAWSKGGQFHFLAVTLIFFIFVSNMLGLPFQLISGHTLWWKSPTADPTVTLTLSTLIILLTHYYGVEVVGTKWYFQNYTKPIFLLPINVSDAFTSTLTLALLSYGNIPAGELVLVLLAGLVFDFPAGGWLIGLPGLTVG